MYIYEIPKECPYCHHLVDAAAARTSSGYACPNCNERIIYTLADDNKSYYWAMAIPGGYGAMNLLEIEVAAGEKDNLTPDPDRIIL